MLAKINILYDIKDNIFLYWIFYLKYLIEFIVIVYCFQQLSNNVNIKEFFLILYNNIAHFITNKLKCCSYYRKHSNIFSKNIVVKEFSKQWHLTAGQGDLSAIVQYFYSALFTRKFEFSVTLGGKRVKAPSNIVSTK